jgi:hypothetical protein
MSATRPVRREKEEGQPNGVLRPREREMKMGVAEEVKLVRLGWHARGADAV